ncbi:MAG: HAMP domain-containing sensor histidine kinase [Eubacteriaceae bacterium]
MYSNGARFGVQISRMKRTIFSRLMLYLGTFFILLCILAYVALSSLFEIYYTKSRTEALENNTLAVEEAYNQNGFTEEVQELIDWIGDEGTVVQIIKKETNIQDTVSKGEGSLGEVLVPIANGTAPQVVEIDRIVYNEGTQPIEKIGAAQSGSQRYKDSDSKGMNNEGVRGQGNGTGQGSGLGQGNGAGSGNNIEKQESLETQIEKHNEGETFITILGNNDNVVEWITYKTLANDGAQVIGRIPSYSIHDVIHIVQNFLMVFLFIILCCSLIFAYFFAKGISKPIVTLNNLAKEMGALNFSNKYQGSRKDEIGELGFTLNQISDELEETIEKLQMELNKERTMEKLRQRFTAQVSHEIQTPLAIIKSYAEALEDGILESSEEEQEHYNTIVKEADKVSGIATDLLDLSQIESGAYQLMKEKVNGYEILEAAIERIKHIDPQKNISLVNHSTGDCVVNVDKKRLEQVFYNLMSNAIKHVTPEDGKIEVVSQFDKELWKVSVYNDGEVIPENEGTQIWEYFYKVESEKKGTGLGLAIVKGIVECHQGRVGNENLENGVLFYVEIPIK